MRAGNLLRNVNTSKWVVNQIIALDNPLLQCDLKQCSVQSGCKHQLFPNVGEPPTLPPSFWSHPDIFPTFRRDTWPNIWVGSSPGDIKGDGNYRFQAFWPERISGSQTVGVAGPGAGGVTGPRRDSEKKKMSVDFPKYLNVSLPVCLGLNNQRDGYFS